MPLKRRVCLTVEVIERPAFPQPVANEKIAIVHINGHRVGRVGLDFHGMGTGVPCRQYRVLRPVDGPVMIGRHFGNDKWREIAGNLPLSNKEPCVIHISNPLFQASRARP